MKMTLLAGLSLAGLLLLALAAYLVYLAPAVVIVPPNHTAVIVPAPVVTPKVPHVVFIGVTTVPVDLAKNQGVINNIVITFSEAMDPATVNQNTFMVKGPNNAAISGAITSDATKKVWTFNPANSLGFNLVYNVTVTTGAKGVSGNSLVKNFLWSFTTEYGGGAASPSPAPAPVPSPTPAVPVTPAPTVPPSSSAGPAAVNLGTAGNFAILSKAGISTTGTTLITGDIGVSPAAASYITGFGPIMDASNQFAASSLVTGKVYAADYAPPTPINMGTAIGDMETAYTDAAGRTLPDATELGAGDISGMTIAPGLYKWGTGVVINNGVTLNCQGNANAVYIFQIAQDLTVGNGAIITLSGGCQAKNIFWQVAGQATLGTTSNFKGNILSQTAIEMNTGATLNGRALAQTAVTLDANTVTIAK